MRSSDQRPPVVMLSGIRWDFLWQRHQILATLFARAGYPTIFVETTGLSNPRPGGATARKVLRRLLDARGKGRGKVSSGRSLPPNLTVYPPLVAPPTQSFFRRLNRAVFVPRATRDLRRILGGVSPVAVAYPPTRTTLDLLAALDPRLTLYDCSENYEGFPGIPRDVGLTEIELLGHADLVSCTSAFLLEKVRPFRPDAFLNGPGVDYERFAAVQASRDRRPDGEIRTVCFFGHLSEERVDFAILEGLAQRGFRVRLLGGVGRVQPGFFATPGIEYRGEVPHEELPAALAGADALVIPYRINALTLGISPAKIYESLATGLPVVATPLPELKRLGGYVYLAEGAEGFAEALHRLPQLEDEGRVHARMDLARENSWETRFAEIEARIRRRL